MRRQVPLHALQLWGNYEGNLKDHQNQYIWESSSFANISDMNQLQMGNHKKITKSQCTDVSSTIANIAAIKQVQ